MTCSFGGGVYPSIRTGMSPMLQKICGTRLASVAASTPGIVRTRGSRSR